MTSPPLPSAAPAQTGRAGARGRARSAANGADGPTHPLFAERYRAIDARDARFDGQFFTAVSSTGVYCRPSCPARTPKPENVTFYLTSAAAQEAGYRACRRCLPEATPGTPEWDLRRDLAARAMRLVTDGVVDREGVDGLAARLGYTVRHVHRVLVAELGAGPLPLARARRAQSARALLVGSDLPVAQVAFAAGFGSVRQLNDTVRAVFDASPSELRRRLRTRAAGRAPAPRAALAPRAAVAHPSDVDAQVRLDVELPVRHPFDAAGVFRFLAARAVAGVETADVSDPDRLRYARTLALPGGPAAVEIVATRADARRAAGARPRAAAGDAVWRLTAHLELRTLADVAPAVARIRRMLDLDADPVAVDAALGTDPALAQLVARTPGIRVPGAADPHELVVRAIVGQQISVAAARTHLSRLAAHAGTPYSSTIPGLTQLFPTAEQIVAHVPEPPADTPLDPDRLLRLPGQSVRAVLATARTLAGGELDVHIGADAETMRAALLARPRIGEWTACYIVMRVLGDPDVWLAGDVALVAGARTVGMLDPDLGRAASHRALAAHSSRWAPWRSYAVMHLWQAATAADSRKDRS